MRPCALILLLAAACSEPPAAREPPPPPVRVEEVTLVPRSPVVRVTAPIQAERRATLRTEAEGRVVEAPVREGATVQSGDVLLRLGGPRSAVAVTSAEARVEQARVALRQLTRAREDAEALAQENASTPRLVESARDREAEAQARLAESEAGLQSARATLADTTLRAPFSGVLVDFLVREGEYVRPGTDVAVLVDPASLEAELLLDPVAAADVREGARVAVHAASHPDERFEGRLTFVGDVLDPRSRRLPVRAAIEDRQALLRPGEIATFEVDVGEPREVAVLPERAVEVRMGRAQVFLIRDDRAVARDVVLGEVREGRAEIVSGLEPGDRVVVEGVERVVDGEPVRVITAVADGDREGS
jgi:membrane fusion protein (multidrug efflux system)